MPVDLRVFVNERAYSLPSGSRVRDAILLAAPGLLAEAGTESALITDARGLPIGLDTPLAAGAILRAQRSSRRSPTHPPGTDAES